ncbi:hypothetical protein PR048_005713 [Dryococelus australis]|uniref:DDE Tnp4 domain-containing protein n=1 Tax=Dryococelus australis TaxID=614101 RepID=A0ABQ9I8X8_9NEOP|nr:hypothetical protein PR048_005713 [Dryococelus australis]
MAPFGAKHVLRCCIRFITHVLISELESILQNQKKKRDRIWDRDCILRRNTLGASETLLRELAVEDPDMYDSKRRYLDKASSPFQTETRNFITLDYLAIVDSLSLLQYFYRMTKCSISRRSEPLIQLTYWTQPCTSVHVLVVAAVTEELSPCFLVSQDELLWTGFQRRWNFPQCLVAMDCKHIVIRNPPHCSSDFYNYKSTFSLFLLASNYFFSYIDVEAKGRVNKANIFRNSNLFAALDEDKLRILSSLMMRFRLGLSRARHIAENTSGILVSRFGIFERPLNVGVDTADRKMLVRMITIGRRNESAFENDSSCGLYT